MNIIAEGYNSFFFFLGNTKGGGGYSIADKRTCELSLSKGHIPLDTKCSKTFGTFHMWLQLEG